MSWSQTFSASRTSAREARDFATGVLTGLQEVQRGAIALIVSELAANCVLHAESAFTVSIEQSGPTINIEVADHGDGHPVMRSPGNLEPNGRGLQIVNSLADSWHVEHGEHGTVVRVVVNLDTDPGHAKRPRRPGATAEIIGTARSERPAPGAGSPSTDEVSDVAA
jgi:serine/threonine-protein kinase RsbW